MLRTAAMMMLLPLLVGAAATASPPELPAEFRAPVTGRWQLGEDASSSSCRFAGWFHYSSQAKRYRYDVVVEDPLSPLCQTVTHGMTDLRFMADASDKANPATGTLDMVGRPEGAPALACVHLSSQVGWIPADLLKKAKANGTEQAEGAKLDRFVLEGGYADRLPLQVFVDPAAKRVAALGVPRSPSNVGMRLDLGPFQEAKAKDAAHPDFLALPQGLKCVSAVHPSAASLPKAAAAVASAAASAAGPARRRAASAAISLSLG